MSIDYNEHYDKIYRYCYFKLHNREIAEDITQETFLRYLEHYRCLTETTALKCLYTIARNLCTDEYRKPRTEALDEDRQDPFREDSLLTHLSVRTALSHLTQEEQELLLLRYVNEVPVAAISRLWGISRFAVYRKLMNASAKFRKELRKEEHYALLEE